jgi:hypothetical protein
MLKPCLCFRKKVPDKSALGSRLQHEERDSRTPSPYYRNGFSDKEGVIIGKDKIGSIKQVELPINDDFLKDNGLLYSSMEYPSYKPY